MYERILIPLDGSATAEAILPQIRRLLHWEDAEIVLLRTIIPAIPETDYVAPPQDLVQEAKRYLAEIEKKLSDDGVRARSIMKVGNPAETILDVAAEIKASMIAMSTHGRSGVQRWIFGSVTEKVLRASPVPVFVVRSFGEAREIRRILVPIDGSDLSFAVLAQARGLAKLFDSEIVVLHVIEEPDRTFVEEKLQKRLSSAIPDLEGAGIRVRLLVRNGDPAAQILDVAKSEAADLVAMSTHGRSGLGRWVFGSVTERVLREAAMPILVVRVAPARKLVRKKR